MLSDLSPDEGRQQVRLVAKRLTRLGVKPDVILTSPYARAVQTAAIIAKILGLEGQLRSSPPCSQVSTSPSCRLLSALAPASQP